MSCSKLTVQVVIASYLGPYQEPGYGAKVVEAYAYINGSLVRATNQGY